MYREEINALCAGIASFASCTRASGRYASVLWPLERASRALFILRELDIILTEHNIEHEYVPRENRMEIDYGRIWVYFRVVDGEYNLGAWTRSDYVVPMSFIKKRLPERMLDMRLWCNWKHDSLPS